MKNYLVYIIYSEKCEQYYIGHTQDLIDRLKRHNQNRSKFTKNKGPWEIIVTKKCNSKSEAYQLEIKLKKMKNAKKAIDYLANVL